MRINVKCVLKPLGRHEAQFALLEVGFKDD